MTILARLLLTAALSFLGVSVGAAQPQGEAHQAKDGASMQMKSSPGAASKPFDLQFLDTMSAHHKSGIEMAKLAEKQAASPELKQMAKKMIEDQQGEIKQMKTWKTQWYPKDGDALNMEMQGMAQSMKGMPENMKKLKAESGKKFDSSFLQVMSKHHAGAIEMSEAAQSKAEHQELKDFATKLASSQSQERQKMQKMKEGVSGAK